MKALLSLAIFIWAALALGTYLGALEQKIQAITTATQVEQIER